ncbi:MAG: TrmH family RNA methyltransferase [Hymenobacter sp.]
MPSWPCVEALRWRAGRAAHARAARWPTCALPPSPLVLVLEAVEKPGNLGAILRTADAAPAHAVLVGDPRTDLYNPNVIRASLGGIFTVPTVAAPMAEILAFLKEKGHPHLRRRPAPTTPRPTPPPTSRGPTALVLGTEADGLTPATRQACDETIIIPMRGRSTRST